MTYLIIKSLHIVIVIAWFAGLFYLVRLFVYHTEAMDAEEPKRTILSEQYHIMESRLHKIICTPAMVLTWILGITMIVYNGGEWFKINTWLHSKMIFVLILTIYHERNRKIIKQLHKGIKTMSSESFRLYNEVPTLLLLIIILLAICKNMLNIGYALLGILIFAVVMVLFMKAYKIIRLKNVRKR